MSGVAVMFEPGAGDEKQDEDNNKPLLGGGEDEDVEEAFHVAAYRRGSLKPAARKPSSRSWQESHSPQAMPSADGS